MSSDTDSDMQQCIKCGEITGYDPEIEYCDNMYNGHFYCETCLENLCHCCGLVDRYREDMGYECLYCDNYNVLKTCGCIAIIYEFLDKKCMCLTCMNNKKIECDICKCDINSCIILDHDKSIIVCDICKE